MRKQLSKLEELRKMGWSKDDIMQLFQEIADIVVSNVHYVCPKTRKDIFDEFFRNLGFRGTCSGTIILKDMVWLCLEEKNPDLLFKQELYPTVMKEYNLSYETVRSRVRESLYKAFDEPTELANTLFARQIKKRGHPTTKEFILEAYDYLIRILPEGEVE